MAHIELGRREVLAAALAATAMPLRAETPFAGSAVDRGWQEAVVSASDLGRMQAALEEIAGWREIGRARTRPEMLRLWGLGPEARGEERLLANPGDPAGFVRLVKLSGAGPQVQIRSSAMPWDTGGIFSLMTRSYRLDEAFARAQALGLSAFNDPTDFDFGGVVLRNVVLRLPDGVNIAVYERRRPVLTGWDTAEKLSAPFNAMQMIADRDRTRDYWARVFGYTPFAQGAFLDSQPGPNNFALPQNLTTSVERRYAIMAMNRAEVGRVEAMQFAGLSGRDLTQRARFPNLGIAALRYPTRRLDAILAAARTDGYPVAGPIKTLLAPYGPIRLAHLTSPDGVITEAFEPLTA